MDSQISTDLTATSEELIESFKLLIQNCSGNLDTLNQLDEILSNEIERVSSKGSVQNFCTLTEKVECLDDRNEDAEVMTDSVANKADCLAGGSQDINIKPDPSNLALKDWTSLQNLVDVKLEHFSPDTLHDVSAEVKDTLGTNDNKYIYGFRNFSPHISLEIEFLNHSKSQTK